MEVTYRRLPGAINIKSRYAIEVDGVQVGEVLQRAGRSFTGAWRAWSTDGRMVDHNYSRKEAVARLLASTSEDFWRSMGKMA